jgi:hypothetical protein
MVLEFLTQILSYMQQVDSTFLMIIFFIFIILAYKVFQTVMKAVIIGVIAASFPFIANMFLGFNVPITINSILWFAITGVIMYFAYSFISGGVKIVKLVLKPFNWMFKKKDKKK